MPNHTTNGDRRLPPRQSTPFLDVLRAHLAIFSEHYRQPITELSVMAYAQDLADLTPNQLDAACSYARKTSVFMPVSATIRQAHQELHSGVFLGPPQIEYPEVSQEEREAALAESAAFSEQLKKHFTMLKPETPAKKKLTVVPSKLSIEEQKKILREKGLL